MIGKQLKVDEGYQANFINELMIISLEIPRVIGVDYVYLMNDAEGFGMGLLRSDGTEEGLLCSKAIIPTLVMKVK